MGLFDDLKKSVAKTAAKESARQTGRALTAAVERLAGEFLDDAEKMLGDARTARGLDNEEAAEAPAPEPEAQPSLYEQRKARQAAAADELARLKAARESRGAEGESESRRKKTL